VLAFAGIAPSLQPLPTATALAPCPPQPAHATPPLRAGRSAWSSCAP